jgi:hypothetical protein
VYDQSRFCWARVIFRDDTGQQRMIPGVAKNRRGIGSIGLEGSVTAATITGSLSRGDLVVSTTDYNRKTRHFRLQGDDPHWVEFTPTTQPSTQPANVPAR